jgi:hypothetical protein
MKKSKVKVTAREWFYLGCLGLGAALAIVAVSIIGSRPPKPDHPSSWLEAPGVVPWYTLSKVKYVLRDGKGTLQFGEGIVALDGKEVTLRGYITPLQMGTEQRHFLLGTKPPSCAFCIRRNGGGVLQNTRQVFPRTRHRCRQVRHTQQRP